VAELTTDRHFPPGSYPVVVLGSGAGGIQTSYCLRALGIEHALLSGDEAPAGMFRRFPFFQRLITWTKPYAPAERGSREYQWYDWNSLLAEEPEARAVVPELMDGTSYFPSRDEMERGIATFVERTRLKARFGCQWERTLREDDGFVLETTEGRYRCRFLVVAVGMTEAWKPEIPGLEDVPHYVDLEEPRSYSGASVFVIGKRNSGFEVADGLLPWARQIVLASPRPARISVLVHSTAAARARYMQPYEDHVLGGGAFVLDAATERVEPSGPGFRVHARGTTIPADLTFDVDRVVAATGFGTPLLDLPEIGVKTFYQGRLPSQTPYWESQSVPGIFFAGSITQGAIGLKKYGIPSNSAAVHGFRYNARVLAEHIASELGRPPERRALDPDEVIPFLLAEADHAPELWNQQSYLSRVVSFDPSAGIVDEGFQPLQHFVDTRGKDAVAMAVETDDAGDIHPAAYVRRDGNIEERLLPGDPLHRFDTEEHASELSLALKGLV
jgi:thioredoxin reductase